MKLGKMTTTKTGKKNRSERRKGRTSHKDEIQPKKIQDEEITRVYFSQKDLSVQEYHPDEEEARTAEKVNLAEIDWDIDWDIEDELYDIMVQDALRTTICKHKEERGEEANIKAREAYTDWKSDSGWYIPEYDDEGIQIRDRRDGLLEIILTGKGK